MKVIANLSIKFVLYLNVEGMILFTIDKNLLVQVWCFDRYMSPINTTNGSGETINPAEVLNCGVYVNVTRWHCDLPDSLLAQIIHIIVNNPAHTGLS